MNFNICLYFNYILRFYLLRYRVKLKFKCLIFNCMKTIRNLYWYSTNVKTKYCDF